MKGFTFDVGPTAAVINRWMDKLDRAIDRHGGNVTTINTTVTQVSGDISAHTELTTSAHGGLVASSDSRLTNARTPTAHASSHAAAGGDALTPAAIGASASGHTHSSFAGLTVSGTLRLSDESTPASASAAGTKGDIRWDSNYIYICVATDTWKRAPLGTW